MRSRTLILLIFFTILLNGCQMSGQENERKELSILYSSISDFQRDFGFVKDKFKDLNIKIIEFSPQLGEGMWNEMRYVPAKGADWDSERYIKLVQEQKPDILFFPQTIYSDLLNEGMLSDMSTYAEEDDFKEINSNIAEAFKDLGGGRLYALSDSISSQVLYYNKDLFEQFAIPEPTDQMSWEQILGLAKQFSLRDNIEGLYLLNYDQAGLLLTMGKTNGLKWYDSLNQRTLFDSPTWKKYLEGVVSFYQEGASYASQEDPSDLFLDGKLAMTLNTHQFVMKLNNNNAKKINWGVVTEPVNPNEPDISKTKSFQYLDGIYVETKNFEESLKVWKYINSEEAAKLKYNLSMSLFTVPVRDSLMADNDNRNLAAFYKLKPQFNYEYNDLTRASEKAALLEINGILRQVIEGQLTVDQMIIKLQEDVINAIQSNK
ncbi:ABC transporter substrate-binding protein [Paenibacillus sanfengchensis]|uniref:ABC transporter substrate-binding protein n=1 Tax=Paenibacillus sanfengchensis TaxID=3119819 RepID=UPI002FE067DA